MSKTRALSVIVSEIQDVLQNRSRVVDDKIEAHKKRIAELNKIIDGETSAAVDCEIAGDTTGADSHRSNASKARVDKEQINGELSAFEKTSKNRVVKRELLSEAWAAAVEDTKQDIAERNIKTNRLEKLRADIKKLQTEEEELRGEIARYSSSNFDAAHSIISIKDLIFDGIIAPELDLSEYGPAAGNINNAIGYALFDGTSKRKEGIK